MCILCVEWERQRMTANEVRAAVGEIAKTDENPDVVHLLEVLDKVTQSEIAKVGQKNLLAEEMDKVKL